jgi:hypothetical protein
VLNYCIVHYDSLLMIAKIIKMSAHFVDKEKEARILNGEERLENKEYGILFMYYGFNVIGKINDVLRLVGDFIYFVKYQPHRLNRADLDKFEKLIEISYLLIKLIMFYLWSVLKLAGKSELEIFNTLKIANYLGDPEGFFDFVFEGG